MNITGFLSSLSGSSSIITRSVGTFHFDAVTSESHDSTLRLTENPVESGAAIADHAVLEPKEIMITGIMVGYTPPDYLHSVTGIDGRVFDRFPLPIGVRAVTAQAKSMINRYGSVVVDANEKATRSLAPFLPDHLGGKKDESATMDRVGMAYDRLLTLQKNGEFIDVLTGVRRYSNMVITNITLLQTVDLSAEIGITAREVFIAESQTASGIHPDMNSAPKVAQKGQTTPKKVDTTARGSILNNLFG